ncbi:MAG: siderophore-interacting protein, partial [Nocardioidaceae bacterium]
PREHWPVTRTYTVRAWDSHQHEMTLDVVVHGDDGLAGPWAHSAGAGAPISFLGPGGGYAPDQGAAWHLLVGDESALPAIAVSLERLHPTATALVLLEVENSEEQQDLVQPAGATVSWIHRHAAGVVPGTELLEALRAATFPPGSVDAFVHGEAGMVKAVRSYLRFERGVAREALSASGYWRRGCTDEGWRAVKGQWKADIDQEEAAASGSALAR